MWQSPWKFDGQTGTSRLQPSCLQRWPLALLWELGNSQVLASASEICIVCARIESITSRMTYWGVLIKRGQGLQRDSRWAYSCRRNCNEDMQQLQSLVRWFGAPDLPLATREFL